MIDEAVLRKLLLKYLRLEPCHVTGMHDPSHTTKAVCNIQKAELLDRLLTEAGLTLDEVARELHDEDCRSCHRVPREEKYRQEQRELYAWAGAEVPPELAATADDVVRPGDKEKLIAALGELEPGKWFDWRVQRAWSTRALFGEPISDRDLNNLHAQRANRAVKLLAADGLLDEKWVSAVYSFRRAVSS